MIVISRLFFRKDYVGLTLWPFIILKEDRLRADSTLINHERIHLRQQRELLLLPFFLLYAAEWLLRAIWLQNGYLAYKNLSFEREAYANEDNPYYLPGRKSFSFVKYF